MSLNAFLHPRNPYRTRPDFKALATKYPEFRRAVTTTLEGKVKIDFTDREAVRDEIGLGSETKLSLSIHNDNERVRKALGRQTHVHYLEIELDSVG